jgi:hypothetical protein
MKRRSPKWQTVTLPADKFRQCAVQIYEFLLEEPIMFLRKDGQS